MSHEKVFIASRHKGVQDVPEEERQEERRKPANVITSYQEEIRLKKQKNKPKFSPSPAKAKVQDPDVTKHFMKSLSVEGAIKDYFFKNDLGAVKQKDMQVSPSRKTQGRRTLAGGAMQLNSEVTALTPTEFPFRPHGERPMLMIHQAAASGFSHGISFLHLLGKANGMVKSNIRSLLEETDERGWTALHWAAFCGRADSVRRLAATGAVRLSATTTEGQGQTALHIACAMGLNDVVQALCNQSEDLLDQANDCLMTPPMLAVEFGQLHTLKLLQKYIDWRTIKTMHGYYATHVAAIFGQAASLEFLGEMGADLEKPLDFDRSVTPAELVARFFTEESVERNCIIQVLNNFNANTNGATCSIQSKRSQINSTGSQMARLYGHSGKKYVEACENESRLKIHKSMDEIKTLPCVSGLQGIPRPISAGAISRKKERIYHYIRARPHSAGELTRHKGSILDERSAYRPASPKPTGPSVVANASEGGRSSIASTSETSVHSCTSVRPSRPASAPVTRSGSNSRPGSAATLRSSNNSSPVQVLRQNTANEERAESVAFFSESSAKGGPGPQGVSIRLLRHREALYQVEKKKMEKHALKKQRAGNRPGSAGSGSTHSSDSGWLTRKLEVHGPPAGTVTGGKFLHFDVESGLHYKPGRDERSIERALEVSGHQQMAVVRQTSVGSTMTGSTPLTVLSRCS